MYMFIVENLLEMDDLGVPPWIGNSHIPVDVPGSWPVVTGADRAARRITPTELIAESAPWPGTVSCWAFRA